MKTTKNEDIAYAMIPFKILSWPVGTWPLQTYNRFAFIRFIVTICILLLMQLTLNSEVCLNSSNAETNLDALMLIVCGNLALSKVMSFRIHSAKLICNFMSAVKDYDELNEEKKRMIMRRHAYMGRVAFVCVVVFGNVCAAILTAVPVLLKDNQDINMTVEDALQFPVPSEHIVLLLKVPENLYFLVFLVEYIMMLFTIAGNLGSDLLFAAIVFHLCGQAEILKMQFNRLVSDNGKTTESFRLLIERHDYLLKLSKMLYDTISSVLVIQLLASCVLICTCEKVTKSKSDNILREFSNQKFTTGHLIGHGFQFIIALNARNAVMVVKAFVILATLMVQLFSYSYVGNYLKSQMDGIGYSLYSCSWYGLPTNVARNIIFVIQKAQVPVYLTAGKFFVINLETYMSILKTSMSYLSVLRVMINT